MFIKALSRRHYTSIPGATLDLNFKRRRAKITGAGDGLAVASVVSANRNSAGSVYNEQGLYEEAPANALRFDHVPRNGAPRGLRVEPAASYYGKWSSAPDNAVYTVSNASLTPNNAPGIDGSLTWGRFTETSTSAVGRIGQTITIPSASSAWIGFWHVRRVGDSRRFVTLDLSMTGGTAVTGSATFDIIIGIVVGYTGPVSAYIESAGMDSWKISISAFNGGANTSLRVSVGRTLVAEPPYQFDVGDAGYANVLAPPSSIRTQATTIVRAADIASISMAANQWFLREVGTMVVDAEMAGDTGQAHTLFAVRNAAADQMFWAYRNPSQGAIIVVMQNASGSTQIPMYGMGTLPRRISLAISYAGAVLRVAMNGGDVDYTDLGNGVSEVANPFLMSVAPSSLDIGHFNGGAVGDLRISQLTYAPILMTGAELSEIVRN